MVHIYNLNVGETGPKTAEWSKFKYIETSILDAG
jgi:hypothetical protein